jgi:uroporphyrinogen-III decarboxylase
MTYRNPNLPDNWNSLASGEKRKYRLDKYLDTKGIKFASPEAEKNYKIRAKRMVDVLNVEEPDMVPVTLPLGNLPLTLAGLNVYDSMYDYEKTAKAYTAFNAKYSDELEIYAVPSFTPGRVMELLDYKQYIWPGYGLPEEASGHQFVEGEYMTPDEYDDFIRDPSDFWLRTYLPRAFSTFEPFRMFQPFTAFNEIVHVVQFSPLGAPETQDMLKKMLEAGKEFNKAALVSKRFSGLSAGNGFPVMGSIFCKAPFDTLSDTLRSTKGIIRDMFARPEKLLKALDVMADVTIANTLKSPNFNSAVIATYPLHKGADGWMSQKQFDTFYFPSLKKVMDALINEGLIQRLFAEGGYNTRLEAVNQFARGTVSWYFDQTDMAMAKKVLGKNCCIQGNIPAASVIMATPGQIKEQCRQLIETCGKGGGYILTSGAMAGNPSLDNLKAMLEAVHEYGVYKK